MAIKRNNTVIMLPTVFAIASPQSYCRYEGCCFMLCRNPDLVPVLGSMGDVNSLLKLPIIPTRIGVYLICPKHSIG